MSKRTEQPTQQVHWRLPANLVADCIERDGENWAQGFRDLLERWGIRDRRLDVPTGTVSKSFSMPSNLLHKLETEARRLTRITGREWTAMQVAREIWYQQQIRNRRK